jgi:DNA-binding GntR family transcriptional regulator
MPSVVRQRLTKTEVAARWLREQIRLGELQPGDRLRVQDLASDLGMSPTPIREAFRLLQTDGFLDYRAHMGYVVSPPGALGEILALRAALEPLATNSSVPIIVDSPRLLDSLEQLHERYGAAVDSGRGRAVAERNAEWHALIYETSGWTLLVDFIRRLWEAFPWRTMWAAPGHSALSYEEHERVMQAIRAGDAEFAANLMRDHIRGGGEWMMPASGTAGHATWLG